MSRPEGWTWDKFFLEMAEHVATASKDPSTKVGCVIVDEDTNRIMGVGFNGFPRGMCDHKELYDDREVKKSRTVHAETNAILNSQKTVDCTAYVTTAPCANCALVLIQAGISRVVCSLPTEDFMSRWRDDVEKAKGFFEEVEVEFELIGSENVLLV